MNTDWAGLEEGMGEGAREDGRGETGEGRVAKLRPMQLGAGAVR